MAAAKSEGVDKDLPFFRAAPTCYAPVVAMQVNRLGAAPRWVGYVRDFPVERMMRDAKGTQIYEGTNQIQRVVIARQSLK